MEACTQVDYRCAFSVVAARIPGGIHRLLDDRLTTVARLAHPANPMKAIVYCDYGVANLKLEEIEKPDSDETIRSWSEFRAASINPYDWHFVEGTPYVMRAMGVGLRKPKDTRLGVDFAGTVEAVGKNVTQFKPGDEVFGGRGGAFAQYVCPRATRAVALKPANVSFEEAASVNIAAITALQALRDKGKVQPGQKELSSTAHPAAWARLPSRSRNR